MSITINNKIYEAVIFDLDDTLIDTSHSYDETIKRTVKHYTNVDIEDTDLRLLRTHGIPYGVNNDWHVTYLLISLINNFQKETWKHILVTESLDKIDRNSKKYLKIKDFFQAIYLGKPYFNGQGLIDTAEKKLYKGNFFPKLKTQGVKIAVVTGRATPEAFHTLKINGLIGQFIDSEAWIIAADSVNADGQAIGEKPSSAPILECAKRLNLPLKSCIYVGNSMSDYIAAKNAPVDFIHVGTSNIKREDEVKSFNYMKLKNVNDIFHFVQK